MEAEKENEEEAEELLAAMREVAQMGAVLWALIALFYVLFWL